MIKIPEKYYGPTRGRILRVAARLFSESGYTKVTTREIAQAVDINVASIYHYFPSKADILKSLYEFYSDALHRALPDLNELLKLAQTHPPHEVLMKTECHFDAEIRDFLDQILLTATREIGVDPESDKFVLDTIFTPTLKILKPLLRHMAESGKIEPLDVDTFIGVFTYYCFSAAALNYSPFGNTPERYRTDLSFIFSMITPAKQPFSSQN